MNDRRADDADPTSGARRSRRRIPLVLTRRRAGAAAGVVRRERRISGRGSRRRRRLDVRRGSRDHRLVAHPERRSRPQPVEGGRGRVHGGPPERHDQDHRAGERGLQEGSADEPAGRTTSPTSSSRGAAADFATRWTPASSRTSPTTSSRGTIEFNGAAASMMKIEDKMYGVPFDLGIVGVWYNKALFKKAGIDAPPETWAELLDDVGKLKDAGITPISLAAGDKWPGDVLVRLPGPARRRRRGDAAGGRSTRTSTTRPSSVRVRRSSVWSR